MGELRKYQYENMDRDKENEPATDKRKTNKSIFASRTHVITMGSSTRWAIEKIHLIHLG